MRKYHDDYSTYTIQDLLDDLDFLNWIYRPSDELDNQWKTAEKTYPILAELIPQARQIVASLNFRNNSMTESELQDLWQKIAEVTIVKSKTILWKKIWAWTSAAAILIGIAFGVLFLNNKNNDIYVTTAYAQMKTVTLPDGTKITLNANSKVHYFNNWSSDRPREVWTEGEVFFEVNHIHKSGSIKNGDRFLVHTDKLNIEVLGTVFNVNSRRNKVNVELLSGKISLYTTSHNSGMIILRPGEFAQYEQNKKEINVKKTAVENSGDWIKGKLHFNKTPVAEVFHFIEDVYGYKIVIKNQNVLQKTLTGTFMNNNQNDFFKAISLALNVSISGNDTTHQLTIN